MHIVGLEENLFPSQMAMQSRADLEEERRLFYVALTRAEETCALSFAQTRYRFGQVITAEPSRFLDEIDERYVEYSNAKAARPTPFAGGASFEAARQQWKQMPTAGGDAPTAFGRLAEKAAPKPEPRPFQRFSTGGKLKRVDPAGGSGEAHAFHEGSLVSHERFGKGKIVKIEGAAPNTKATVFFPEAGTKQLLLKFAKLTPIDE